MCGRVERDDGASVEVLVGKKMKTVPRWCVRRDGGGAAALARARPRRAKFRCCARSNPSSTSSRRSTPSTRTPRCTRPRSAAGRGVEVSDGAGGGGHRRGKTAPVRRRGARDGGDDAGGGARAIERLGFRPSATRSSRPRATAPSPRSRARPARATSSACPRWSTAAPTSMLRCRAGRASRCTLRPSRGARRWSRGCWSAAPTSRARR